MLFFCLSIVVLCFSLFFSFFFSCFFFFSFFFFLFLALPRAGNRGRNEKVVYGFFSRCQGQEPQGRNEKAVHARKAPKQSMETVGLSKSISVSPIDLVLKRVAVYASLVHRTKVSSSYWPQVFNSLSLCSFLFATLFPSVTLAATGVFFFQVRRQISTHLLKFVTLAAIL